MAGNFKKILIISLTAVVLIAGFSGWYFWRKNTIQKQREVEQKRQEEILKAQEEKPFVPETATVLKRKLAKPDMNRMKTQGCVTDGFLSSFGKEYADDLASLIKRSNCYYLHRALESWLTPPDFYFAEEMMDKINKPDIIYGMFIAEAINQKAKYYKRFKY